MDPLSVTASSLALLSAAKAVCDFIGKLIDAPKALSSAKSDVESTISSVQALHTYLSDHSGNALSYGAQLICVLDACTKKCAAFQTQLQNCSKHSAGRTDGKLSLLDRGKLLLKEREIGGFREDMACFRETINVAAVPLFLSSSANSTAAIQELTVQIKKAAIDISRQINSVEDRIGNLEDAGVTPEAAARKALETRKASFVQCQQLIEESRKAAEKNDSFKATYGHLIVGENGISFEGVATDQRFKNVELSFGNTNVGSSAVSMRGFADPEAMKSFFATTTARPMAGQSSSHTNAQSHDRQASTEDSLNRSNDDSAQSVSAQQLTIENSKDRNLWADLVQDSPKSSLAFSEASSVT